MPVGRLIKAVPSHQHSPWPLALVEAQEEIGKAKDGASALVATPPDGLGQRMIRAVGKRVAVDDEQGAGHVGSCNPRL
jgi:hypothetical protein